MTKSMKLKGTKAHQRYRTTDGVIVPGVTTVCGLLAKPFLIKWANRMGLEGIDTTKYVDKAARIGTCAHEMVQEHLGGSEVDHSLYSSDEIDLAENALISYFEWEKNHDMETHLIESQLVSDYHRYGGSIDWYGLMDGKLTLCDLKTGKAIYDEYALQVTAYKRLLEENGHPVEQVRIIRIGRDATEGFEDRVFDELFLDTALRIFDDLLDVYYARKIIGMR